MCTYKKPNLLSYRIVDVSDNRLHDLNFEYDPDTLKQLTLGKNNRFECSCDNVNTFGELMGQLNDTANIGLSCKDDDIGEVEIFEAFGTPGMALESRLKVRALNKLTYYNDYLQYLQDNITAVGIIVFDCHVDTYFSE